MAFKHTSSYQTLDALSDVGPAPIPFIARRRFRCKIVSKIEQERVEATLETFASLGYVEMIFVNLTETHGIYVYRPTDEGWKLLQS